MRTLWLVLAMLLVSGCSSTPYVEGFIGYKTREYDGLRSCNRENAGVRIGVERAVSDHIVLKAEYEHLSHLLCGRPFNEESDESTDWIGGVIRYEW